jgi:hypothetical protein
LDGRKRTAEADAKAIVERAQSEADEVLDQAWAEAERLIGGAKADAEDHQGTVAELRRQLERREEEISTTAQVMAAREQTLAGAEAQLAEAQDAFEIQRTDLLREAREQGYALGWAESEASTAAKQARRMAMEVAETVEARPVELETETPAPAAVPEVAQVAIDEPSAEETAEPEPPAAIVTQVGLEAVVESTSEDSEEDDDDAVDSVLADVIGIEPEPEDTPSSGLLTVVKDEHADHEEVNQAISKLRSAWTGDEPSSDRQRRRKWRNSTDR